MPLPSFVSIVGAGNLAWHLAPALDNAGYAVREVYNRDVKKARQLTERLYQATAKADLDFSASKSRVFLLAVSDDALQDITREIILPDEAVLAHTSGAKPIELLADAATPHTGVFYPLQTFSRVRKIEFNEVPFFIESQDSTARQVLFAMGRSLSRSVHDITSENRMALHVAAVFASNFTNHMLALAGEVMHANGLTYDWLKPLIAETISKSFALGPDQAQTGPARRGDFKTLDRHMEFLQSDERLAEVYRVISQHLVDRYTSPEE
jgi:predicted short-subunit dehydrogenase-like oxidoreductase (DUF2520 family)